MCPVTSSTYRTPVHLDGSRRAQAVQSQRTSRSERRTNASRKGTAMPVAEVRTGIEGKVVVVTGAGAGIGAATALLLAAHGAQVVLGGRHIDQLDGLATRITDAGGQAVRA